MDTAEFRRQAHAVADWIADYMEGVERFPVRAQVKPGEIAARLAAAAPESGEPMEQILADFNSVVLPGITHWQHPSFFAYFPANSSPPSVLAEMLTAALGANGMLWQTSPAATEMETRVLDWLRQLTGLPEGLHGVIQDSASSATLCAILTARERATGWRANEEGLSAVPPLAVYCSAEAHSSVEKDVKVAGLGRRQLRPIPADERFAMRPDALEAAIEADRAAGIVPACVVATLGTTGVGAFDPLRSIGEVCQRQGVYLHVDAAWAGSAFILPEHRHWLDGAEYADSFVFNPHKWLFTNFDCSAHFVRNPAELVRTLEILPAYLQTRERSEVTDYRDWSVPLGRRFRALKLWFVMRSFGAERLRERIAAHIALARELEGWIVAEPGFELVAPRSLALVNFRFHPPGVDDGEAVDRLNESLLEVLNASGRLYLTQNRVNGAFAIRLSIGQTWTERRHVEAAWDAIRETAGSLARP